MDVFCDGRVLSNINDAKRHLVLHCNARTTSVTKKGDHKGYGTVCYHPNSLAHILSLNNVKNKYRVTYYSEGDHCFVVHSSKFIFRPSKGGLFYSDMTNDVKKFLSIQ